MKPSDWTRDPKFRDPTTPPFQDEKGMFHVFSFKDVMKVLVNRETAFSRDPQVSLSGGPIHMALDFMWMIEPFTIEGGKGRHDPQRRVVEKWFKERAVRTMEPIIRDLTVKVINEAIETGTGSVNLATELSSRLSMRVICRLTGMELEREDWMREKLDEFNLAPWDKMPLQEDVQIYFWQMIARRLAHPKDELLDVLVKAWSEGLIDDREIVSFIYGFSAAGTDTTGASLVNCFAFLAEYDLLDWAREEAIGDHVAMEKLVEEILRFGTPFTNKPVYCRRDMEFGEMKVPAGSLLTFWISSANRDEDVNGGVEQSSPEIFDPTRWPNKHIAFGWAKHVCLGKDLARLEMKILLEEALQRLPALKMNFDKPFHRYAGIVDSVTECYFEFDQEQAEWIRDGKGVPVPA